MVAVQKPVVAKMKQTTNKKSKHDFQNNDKEESDIEKAKNDDDKDSCKEDDKDEAIKNSFSENTPVAVQVESVSVKNTVTGIIDLLMEDVPTTELLRTLEAAIKCC